MCVFVVCCLLIDVCWLVYVVCCCLFAVSLLIPFAAYCSLFGSLFGGGDCSLLCVC